MNALLIAALIPAALLVMELCLPESLTPTARQFVSSHHLEIGMIIGFSCGFFVKTLFRCLPIHEKKKFDRLRIEKTLTKLTNYAVDYDSAVDLNGSVHSCLEFIESLERWIDKGGFVRENDDAPFEYERARVFSIMRCEQSLVKKQLWKANLFVLKHLQDGSEESLKTAEELTDEDSSLLITQAITAI